MADKVLIAIWLCGFLAIAIMVARLVFVRVYKAKWEAGDSLTAVAIAIAIARLAFLHVTVTYKTNNSPAADRDTSTLTVKEIHDRELGAKFALVSRILYICLIWTMKFVLLSFYHQMVRDIQWGKLSIRVFTVVFVTTWIAGIVTTFVECHPIQLYWQVIPDPGKCAQAAIQLLVVGVTNIVTDIMLIALPIPILISVRLSVKKKIQLGVLFSIGFIIVTITAIRLPFTLKAHSTLGVRLTWTAVELLAATFVANAPKLYGLKHLLDRRRHSSAAGTVPGTNGNVINENLEKWRPRKQNSFEIDEICHVEDVERGSEDTIIAHARAHDGAVTHDNESHEKGKVTANTVT